MASTQQTAPLKPSSGDKERQTNRSNPSISLSPSTAIDFLSASLEILGGHTLNSGASAMVHCPAHNDRNPSLHISQEGDRPLVHCMAGCSQDAVIEALRQKGLWPNKNNKRNLPPGIPWQWKGARFSALWTYLSEAREINGYVARYDSPHGKQVVPFFEVADQKWRAKAAAAPRPLYGLQNLSRAPDLPVLILEGEKACDAAHRKVGQNFVCITWPGGTNAVSKADFSVLKDREVYIWPDADQSGRKAAQAVGELCRKAGARTVTIIEPPKDVAQGWDLADAEAEGWTAEQVRDRIEQHSQKPQTIEPRFKLVKVSDLTCRAPQWIVRQYLEADSLVAAFGDPGCGKSFFGIDVACCVATGIDFHGLAVEAGPVVYIAGEGHNGIGRRLRAWSIRHGQDLSDAPLYVSKGPAALCDSDSASEVLAAVDQVAQGQSLQLVVIDTLARNFGPGDENSTKDMSAFIAACDSIRTRYGCTVLIIHHVGHGDKSRERGAYALRGGLDASYRLDKDENGTVRLTPVKMKEAEEPMPMAFHIRQVELDIQDDEGQQITSAILDPTDYEPPKSSGKKGRGKLQSQALDKLRQLYQEHQKRLESGGFDPNQAQVTVDIWRQSCLDAGMDRRRWSEVRRSLEEAKAVKVEHNFVHLL